MKDYSCDISSRNNNLNKAFDVPTEEVTLGGILGHS